MMMEGAQRCHHSTKKPGMITERNSVKSTFRDTPEAGSANVPSLEGVRVAVPGVTPTLEECRPNPNFHPHRHGYHRLHLGVHPNLSQCQDPPSRSLG